SATTLQAPGGQVCGWSEPTRTSRNMRGTLLGEVADYERTRSAFGPFVVQLIRGGGGPNYFVARRRASSSLAGLNDTRSKNNFTALIRPSSMRSHSTVGT